MYKYKRIAIKIGSNVLTRKDGTLDFTRMSSLTDQIAELHKSGLEVIIILREPLHQDEANSKNTRNWIRYRPGNFSPQWGKPNSSTGTTSCSAIMASPADRFLP